MTRYSRDAAGSKFSAAGRLRIVLRVAALTLWLSVCLPFALIIRPIAPHNPVPRLFLAGAARVLGIVIEVQGRPIRGRAVLLANHVSWLDIPALAAISGTAFVAHSGLAQNIVLRTLCRLNNTVFVAREDRRSVTRQIAEVREAIEESGLLTIFPEGGTGAGDSILPFKSSLLSALEPMPPGVEVRPVWLDYGRDTSQIAWIGDESGLDNFLNIAARKAPLRLSIHPLPPLGQTDLVDRKTIAAAARATIMLRMEAVRRDEVRNQRVAL